MSIKFHKPGYEYTIKLIKAGAIEAFDDDWTQEKPTHDEVNHFLNTHDMKEYGLWFLGVDSRTPETIKEHYVYPHGDLKVVQRCALVDTLEKAKAAGDKEIVKAAQHLLELFDND
jgi:hypothetical protein